MSVKQKRLSYNVNYKLEVVNYAKEHGNRAAERHFGPPPTEKMIREWKKQEEQLKGLSKHKKTLRSHLPKWPELEIQIKNWITNHRSNGISVSTKMIIFEARQWASANGIDDFTGSTAWCYRFMKRHGLSMRTKTSLAQKMPIDYENKIINFHRFIISARRKFNFHFNQIANMDEVPLTFDVPSNRTVDSKGTKSVTIKTTGHEKTHYTVVLTCCADGSKLTPMLIFKRKTLPKDKIPPGIVIHVQDKGWMDEMGMKLWLRRIWANRKGGLSKSRALLVWDQFRSHTTDSIKNLLQEMNTEIAVIPGGLTSQLQPLDVSINKPFKDLMRVEWNKWMTKPNHDMTVTGRMKRPTITEVCTWVKNSWEKIKQETIVKSFKKCGISNAMDGTEDDFVFEESEDERGSENILMSDSNESSYDELNNVEK